MIHRRRFVAGANIDQFVQTIASILHIPGGSTASV
jgi:hypothetical protein